MRCPSCNGEMSCGPGEHLYRESGLDNVYLDGIEICKCPCGEKVVTIPVVTELHNLIALEILQKKSPLNGKEIRFLRKNLGLTAIKLAEIMGVANETISRWETGVQPINEARDRLLRLIYSNIKGFPPEAIKNLIEKAFVEISTHNTTPPPYMIPVDKWSRTRLCFPE
jgi:putative transcriptional regulator